MSLHDYEKRYALEPLQFIMYSVHTEMIWQSENLSDDTNTRSFKLLNRTFAFWLHTLFLHTLASEISWYFTCSDQKTIRFRRRFWCETFLWHWNCNSLWLNTLLDGFFGWNFTKHHIVASLRFQKLIHTRLNQIFLWLIMFHKCWRTNEFYSFCLFHCHKFGFRVVIDSKI